ncbi:MAG: hypothetical protein IJT25_02065 [Clostridia bacterium]|nr:hypothetical protein [Clostridia bacterium]
MVCPQISSVRDACILKNSICFKKNMVIKIIINKIRADLVACDKMLNASQIEKLLDLNCIGIIPENDEFIINSNIKSVLGSSGEIEEALSIIAENLHYNKNSKLDYLHKYKGILGRIRAKLKKGA